MRQCSQLLARQPSLLILDNCEHLPDLALLVAELLACTPDLRVFATSRIALRIRAEVALPVPSLDPERVAAQLFIERAEAWHPGSTNDPALLPTISALCRRLDGVPLAIELAAAQLDRFTVPELLVQLEVRFALLRDGPRNLPARQRTLFEAIAWSFQLLSPEAQALFASCAVFRGDFDHAALSAAHGELVEQATLDELLGHHLIVVDPAAESTHRRYTLLESLREFAALQLLAQIAHRARPHILFALENEIHTIRTIIRAPGVELVAVAQQSGQRNL
jgi:predicted ATPase